MASNYVTLNLDLARRTMGNYVLVDINSNSFYELTPYRDNEDKVRWTHAHTEKILKVREALEARGHTFPQPEPEPGRTELTMSVDSEQVGDWVAFNTPTADSGMVFVGTPEGWAPIGVNPEVMNAAWALAQALKEMMNDGG